MALLISSLTPATLSIYDLSLVSPPEAHIIGVSLNILCTRRQPGWTT